MNKVKKILFFAICIFLLFSLTRNLFEYKKNLSFYSSSRLAYEKTAKEQVQLKTELKKAESITEIEKTIRNSLNLARKNETILILPPSNIQTPSPTPTYTPVHYQWFTVFFRKNNQ